MTPLRTLLIATAFGLAATTAASAFPVSPEIPTPANPHPELPVATDGTPLPSMGWAGLDAMEADQGYGPSEVY